MNHKRLISLTICCILAVVLGLPVQSFAGNESETNAKAERHLEKANELRKLADYDTAIAEYEKVISTSPKSDIALNAQYWIGQSHFKAGQLDASLAAFQTLLDGHPTSRIVASTKRMTQRVQQAKKEKSLIEAVEKDDVEQLNLFILGGADVNNVKDPNGMTLLHLAIRYGHADIATLLINKGADVNAMDEHTYTKTPLHWAAMKGHTAVAELLIARGADVNAHGTYGHTPMQYAAGRGHLDVVELLLSKGADVEAANHWNVTPLFAAASGGHLDVVELLLSKGADIEARKRNRATPLHEAASANSLEVAKLLLDRGAYVDVRNFSDKTPLHSAVLQGHKEMVELLLAHRASIHRCYRGGQGLMMLPMYTNQKEMVKFLIDKGIRRHSPVHIAAFMGDLDEVKRYLAVGGNIDAQDPSHQLTLLMCALFGQQTAIMEFLISKGANINLQDGEGKTALHRATDKGKVEIVRMLFDKGADVNIRDYYGCTPLNFLAGRLDMEVFKMIIAKGVDVNAKGGLRMGDEGWTALHQVCWAGNKAKAEVLIAHGADINAKSRNGVTPMSVAKARGQDQIVELLRKHGAKE